MELPKHLRLPGFFEKLQLWAGHNLNFYRIHMICFATIPLILSGIFYAANTTFHIAYIDCLFVCFSCMCVTGLSTINLSMLSTFQQFLLYFQMLIGSMMFVSIVMVAVRKHFFRVQFRHVLNERSKREKALSLARTITQLPGATTNNLRKRFATRRPSIGAEEHVLETPPISTPPIKKKKGPLKLTKDMIQRVDGGGVGLVNPMGWYDGATPTHSQFASRAVSPDPDAKEGGTRLDDVSHTEEQLRRKISSSPSERSTGTTSTADDEVKKSLRTVSSTLSMQKGSGPYSGGADLRPVLTTDSLPPPPDRSHTEPMRSRTPYAAGPVPEEHFPRSKTIAFDDQEDGMEHVLHPGREAGFFPRTPTMRTDIGMDSTFTRTNTLRRQTSRLMESKKTGFGGFPTPIEIVGELFRRFVPRASDKLSQSLTMPRTNTLSGRHDDGPGKNVDYITFAATVGRNSLFHNLTEEQIDELGGVEYRALRMLFYIVLCYWVFLPLAGVTITAPYIGAGNRYAHVFEAQPKLVKVSWFAFYQCTSAFSNTGMSLVDQSMLPFQYAYLMSVVMCALILLGNTCFPIVLRFIIWAMWKMVPEKSQSRETLKFLLDHPRRCFVYLFPSTQTWFLLFVVFLLTAIDWIGFIVLDIGTPVVEAMPVRNRVADGIFQSVAVRAAGFTWISSNGIAPAVKVLYVIMMYVSVYPIAMSVRATNVYEERALGVYDDEEEEDDEDADNTLGKQEGAHAVAKYLGWHARRQLAFDMWWIALALWLVCIIERSKLNNPENYEWMNVFNIIFELVSAYGTVGLSLGVPFDNYSLSGSFRTLSKLVVIVVMLRGRHRGLPVAIDRAVMLPKDFTESDEEALESRIRRSRSRRASSMAPDVFSYGSAFPRTFTVMSENQGQHPSVVPPSPRLPTRDQRETSPTMPFRRLGRSSSRGSTQDSGPASPSSPPTHLHFAVNSDPRAGTTFGAMGVPASPTGFTGSGFPTSSQHPNTGNLPPLVEDLASRRPTLTEGAEGEGANEDVPPLGLPTAADSEPKVTFPSGESGDSGVSGASGSSGSTTAVTTDESAGTMNTGGTD